jgi:hypothetical protein
VLVDGVGTHDLCIEICGNFLVAAFVCGKIIDRMADEVDEAVSDLNFDSE